MSQDLPRKIGFWGGSAIMVGIIIGSGIFRTPVSVAKELGSPSLILMLWLIGGVLSLFGALTYAELGTMFPRSGGIYVYIREGLGPAAAFVLGWAHLLITKPLGVSGIATVFAEYFVRLLSLDWDPRWVTCAVLLGITFLNVVGVRLGAGVAVVLTGLKFLALAGIVALALVLTKGDAAHFTAGVSPRPFWTALAPALAAILWTYDGWSDVAAVSGEVREPNRLLPRIFLVGTAATIGLYLAVNAVFIWMVPLEEMRGVPTVAPLVMERLLGDGGGLAVTMIVLVSTLGATHGSILTGARVTFAQARDGLLFAFLGRVHPWFETPSVALWIGGVMACAASIMLEKFEKLTGGFVFTMWIFYALAAASVIVLRVRRPDLPRPVRCWGYPFVPVMFVLSAAVMTVLSIRESPKDTLPWLGVLVGGVPVYYLWRSLRRAQV